MPSTSLSPAPVQPPSAARQPGGFLLRLEPWWVLLLSPLILFPGRIVPMAFHWVPVLALLLFWPLRWLPAKGSPASDAERVPLRFVIALFLLLLAPAIRVSVDRPLSWEAAGYLLLGVSAANALLHLPATRRRPEWVAVGVLLAGLGLSLLGPLIIIDAGPIQPMLDPLQRAAGPLTRLLGETINPNILAHALLAVFPLAAALALTGGWATRRWQRPAASALALWLLFVIFLTQGRGAWLALAIVIPLLLMLRWPRLVWLAPPLLAAAIAAVWWQGPALLDLLATSTATTGIAERVEIWQRALYIMRDFPFTGVGIGTFARVVPVLYPWLLVPAEVVIPDAHNLPLQVAVDLGLPGLVLWLVLQIGVLVLMVRLLRGQPRPLHRALAAGVLVSMVAMHVAGLFGAVNWGVKPAFLPWIIAALGVLLYRRAAVATESQRGAPDRG